MFDCGWMLALAFVVGLTLGLICLFIDRRIFRRRYVTQPLPLKAVELAPAYPAYPAWASPSYAAAMRRPDHVYASGYGDYGGTLAALSLETRGRPAIAHWGVDELGWPYATSPPQRSPAKFVSRV